MAVPKRCHYCGEFPLHQSLGGVKSQGLTLDDQTFAHVACHEEHQRELNQNPGISVLKTGVPISHVDFLAYNFLGKNLLAADTHHLLNPEIHELTLDLMISITKKNRDNGLKTYLETYAKRIEQGKVLNRLKCTKEELEDITNLFTTQPPQSIEIQSVGSVSHGSDLLPRSIASPNSKPSVDPAKSKQLTGGPKWLNNVINRKV